MMGRVWMVIVAGMAGLAGAFPAGRVAAQIPPPTPPAASLAEAELLSVQAALQAAAAEIQTLQSRMQATTGERVATVAALRSTRAELAAAAAQTRAAATAGRRGAPPAVPASWLPQDPADSLYRSARTQLQERRYAEAARTFASIRADFPRSGYAGDSYYFEALARSRMERVEQLQRALRLLNEQRQSHPRAATASDAPALKVRIESELARGGDARAAEAVVRAARGPGEGAQVSCDDEEQALRATALSALLKMDPERAGPLLRELTRTRGECAAHLRAHTVFILARQSTDDRATLELFLDLARNDPDPAPEVLQWLARSDEPEAIEVVLSRVRAQRDDPEGIDPSLLLALAQSSDPRVVDLLADLVTDSSAETEARLTALHWLVRHDRVDAAFLANLYGDLDDTQLRHGVLHAMSRMESSDAIDWLTARALDPDESVEVRSTALFRAGELGLAPRQLLEIYRGASNHQLRSQAIFALTRSPEEEGAVDVLLEIARAETDPALRHQVIFWLGESDDPRVADFLLELLRGGEAAAGGRPIG